MISACFTSNNNFDLLSDTIAALDRRVVNEIIVIDSYSKDLTRKLMKDFRSEGVEFIQLDMKFHGANFRNIPLCVIKNEWALLLDVGETMSDNFWNIVDGLIDSAEHSGINGYCFDRVSTMPDGSEVGRGKDVQTRFVKKPPTHFKRAVHERFTGCLSHVKDITVYKDRTGQTEEGQKMKVERYYRIAREDTENTYPAKYIGAADDD